MKMPPMLKELVQAGVRALIALVLSVGAVAGHAQAIRYRYVSLDQIALPAGFTQFMPAAIANNGRVYGTLCDDVCGVSELAYFKDGSLSVVPSVPGSFAGPTNSRGTIGGAILVDPVNFIFRAALFHDGRVEVVPPQPGEVFAGIQGINDNNTALVFSQDASGNTTYLLYSNGSVTPINFGPSITGPWFAGRCINNNQIIAGTEGFGFFFGARGFRFDPRNGNAVILEPFTGDPSETLAWGQAINQGGNILGYSFTLGVTPYHERIGVWGSNGLFYTHLVESDSSNHLLFNDNNLIVITEIFTSQVSYLVPQPGVRVDLTTLVVNLPPGQDLFSISDLNNNGDMIGRSSTGANFLLQRLDPADHEAYATPSVSNSRHAVPPVVAMMHHRLQTQSGQLK